MHEEMMRLALDEARRVRDDVPVGAVVVLDGAVVASARNAREGLGLPTAHAEILAIERAARALGRRRLTGCTLYVTLEPCPMCAGAIVMSGLEACVFGAFDAQYGCCGSRYHLPMDAAFHHQVPCIGGVLETECRALIDGFFKARRFSAAPDGRWPARPRDGGD